MKKGLSFFIQFLFFLTLLYLLFIRVYSRDNPIIGTSATATILNNIINHIGINSVQLGPTIYLPNSKSINILVECTGLFEIIILSSVILAFPTSLINKLIGVISGIMTISILNIIRLVTITYVLMYHSDIFKFVDIYLWQIGTLVFILIGYSTWLKLINLNLHK